MIKILFFFFLFVSCVYSNIILKSSNTFYENEAFVFVYEISGEDISLPKLQKINNYEVFDAGTSNSYSNYNGSITRKIIKKYIIYPKESFIIPSYTFIIDGKKIQSKEKKIQKEKILKTKSKNFELSIKSDKKNLYVGEESLFTVVFKYKKDLQILDLGLESPKFDNFWSKQLDTNEQYEEDGYLVQKLNFLIFPQKEGILTIPALKISLQIAKKEQNSFSIFMNESETINIYSNELKINAIKLPPSIKLIGDFSLKATVNKNIINKDEAVSYKIEVEGYGNLDDLDDVKLKIKNLTIFENKAVLEKKIINGKYFGKYSKTFSVLAENDFVIPSYSLKYFDKKSKTIKILKTDSFKIKVNNNEKSNEKNIANLQKKQKDIFKIKEVIVYKDSKFIIFEKFVFFILGSIFTIFIFILYKYVKIKAEKTQISPFLKEVKNSSNKNDLLVILAVYIGIDSVLDEEIFKLEKIDNNEFNKIKKEILIILKSLIKKGIL